MKSIQQRLLISLLIGLPLLWLITSSFIAWRLWHEINEMNDTQITQVVRYLIGISANDNDQERSEQENRQGESKSSNEKVDSGVPVAKIYNLKSKELSGDLGDVKMITWVLLFGISRGICWQLTRMVSLFLFCQTSVVL
ncbi:MAG: hypothetical protein ABS881_09290 [Psychrobacter alimentarius]